MAEFAPTDLAVVVPTRDRWDILRQTLVSLSRQTVSGFETIVVVDGTDQRPPPMDVSQVLVKRRAGPASARNAGARATKRSLVMFIGDDTIPAPDLVERHIAAHGRHPEPEAAAVGFVDWHPSVAHNRINRWLEWSGTQTWYNSLGTEGEQEVTHWYFYTSNISMKTSLFLGSGGFDEDFPYAAFEDLEYGLRIARQGLRLFYEPDAVCHHLHDYDWPGLERRFATMAVSERLMVDMHPDVEPGCMARMKAASAARVLPLEPLVDIVPARWKRLDRFVRRQADRSYHRRLAPVYLDAWDRAAELCELRRYLGELHDSARVVYGSTPSLDHGDETASGADERLFELARRGLEGRSSPAIDVLRRQLPSGSEILDYCCGVGSDGLRLAEAGFSVHFADQPGPPLDYLKWRLAERGHSLPVCELGIDELPRGLDVALCLDACSAEGDPAEVLQQLEEVAPIVVLGFSDRTSVPIGTSSSLVARHDLRGGSGLLIYRRSPSDDTAYRHDGAVREFE